MSVINLKKYFGHKILEYDDLKKKGQLGRYDSDTVHTKADQTDASDYKNFMQLKIQNGLEKLIDKTIENAVKMPRALRRKIYDKYQLE